MQDSYVLVAYQHRQTEDNPGQELSALKIPRVVMPVRVRVPPPVERYDRQRRIQTDEPTAQWPA